MTPRSLLPLGCVLVQLVCTARAQLIPGNGTGLAIDANTVAMFRFEDSAATALDSTANNRHATPSSTTTSTGLFGSGRTFDGVDDRLEFSSVFTALSGSSGWTLEYFAKSADGVSAPYLNSHSQSAGWRFYPSGSTIDYGIKTSAAGNDWHVLTSVAAPAMDTAWHYYALTWTAGGALSVYRDGALLGSTNTSGAWGGSDVNGSWMNFDSYYGNYYGAGVVDDLRFSNVARSALEIQTAYNVAAIPEPSTYAVIVGVGALGLAAWRRRSRNQGTS